jgi:hypothetical protein
MKYSEGQQVALGVRVRFGMDDGEHSAEDPQPKWTYLKKGALIRFPGCGLIHYEVAEPDLQLVSRAALDQ